MKKLFPILFISLFALLACEEENITVNDTIRNFIEQKYQGARILTAEKEFNIINLSVLYIKGNLS